MGQSRRRIRAAYPVAAAETREPHESRGVVRVFLRETLLPMVIVIAILVPLRSAVADWNDVPSGSMRPTILEGDRIFVNKLAYGLRAPLSSVWLARWDRPSRGDVVTFASPDDGIRLVKRIVGLPGDQIAMVGNRLIVNGEPLEYADIQSGDGEAAQTTRSNDHDHPAVVEIEHLGDREHRIRRLPTVAGRIDSFDAFTIPADEYFFLGDNRDESRDSRFIGTVALGEIDGRVTHVALSVDPNRSYRPRFERWFHALDSGVE